MSMRALTELLKARVEASSSKNEQRLRIHAQRKAKAEAMTKKQYIRMLKSEAIAAGSRASAKPYIPLTPEMALVLAQYLEKKG